jgi:hypothetical protein
LSPLDLERTFGLVGGDIFHGALSLDQLFSARPMLGHGDYRGPLKGLYMCGSGTHPGGGVTGARAQRSARDHRGLSARAAHLGAGSLALYDLSSSYFAGTHCPLGKIGYSRDGKKNKLQVNYGLMTTREGCPISVSVYEGNTSDTKTLMPQVMKLKESFGLERVVLVGDRGMISHKAIGELKEIEGLAWITALKSGQIRGLVEAGALQLGLFDEVNLFEFSDPKYPGERLIACRNPQLAKLRAHKRQALLEATALELDKIRDRVARGALEGGAAIGVKLGRVLDKYKVGKHFELTITDTAVKYQILEPQVAAEAALDGIYVIRTGLPKKQMSAPDAVRSYKALTQVERAFRSLKTVDLKIRPIHHRLESRVRAHIFLCMLSYYVEWHMIEAWRPMLFADEDQSAKLKRDPVAPASAANRAASTLPPLRMMPTRWAENPGSCEPRELSAASRAASAATRAAANPRQPVGSTTIFMRSAKKRMHSMSSSSVAVSMSAAPRRMISNVTPSQALRLRAVRDGAGNVDAHDRALP